MVKPMEFIWVDGKLVPWSEANVHVMTHSLHYGMGVFEGIRSYRCADGRFAIFRLNSHLNRLFESAAIVEIIKIPYTYSELEKAVIETAQANKLGEGYIRPLVVLGEGNMGPLSKDNPVRVFIIPWKWGRYLGRDALDRGISVSISKWRRANSVLPFQAKITGHYVNAAVARRDAEKAGFDEAIIKDESGYIIEGSAENIFIVKDDILMTPNSRSPILRGITRDSIICLAKDSGMKVEEVYIREEDLSDADEAFLAGTAAEVTPIKNIGEIFVGTACPGPVTEKLQALYFQTVRGELSDKRHWLTYID